MIWEIVGSTGAGEKLMFIIREIWDYMKIWEELL